MAKTTLKEMVMFTHLSSLRILSLRTHMEGEWGIHLHFLKRSKVATSTLEVVVMQNPLHILHIISICLYVAREWSVRRKFLKIWERLPRP